MFHVLIARVEVLTLVTLFHSYFLQFRYFSSKASGNNKIKLDVDVQGGFGPETITIQSEPGKTYYIYVHHYSGSGSLPSSQAVLTVCGVPSLDTMAVSNSYVEYPASHERQMFWLAFVIHSDGKVTETNKVKVSKTNKITWP